MTKVIVMIVLIAGILSLVLTFLRKMQGGPRSSLLSAMGVTGLVGGGLAAAYEGVNTWVAMQMTHTTRLVIMLPSRIEVTYIVIFGLAVWAITLWGNAGARRI